jgi:hypothetical protein
VDPAADLDRNRLILRRTLSFISWQYALFNGILGLLKMQLSAPQGAWMLAHAFLLGGAGFGLWRPRVWGWPAAALAAGGSLGWAVFDLSAKNVEAALVDGAYAGVALLVVLMGRGRRLDNPASRGDNR